MVPLSPTAHALSLVRSLPLEVMLFTMHTELRLVEVGLDTLFMLTVCADTAERDSVMDNRLNAKAIFNENFIMLFHLPKKR